MTRTAEVQRLLAKSLGVDDLTLAEYVTSVAGKGEKELRKVLADFPDDLICSITKILSTKPDAPQSGIGDDKGRREEEPGLSQTNKRVANGETHGGEFNLTVDYRIPETLINQGQWIPSRSNPGWFGESWSPDSSSRGWLAKSAMHTSSRLADSAKERQEGRAEMHPHQNPSHHKRKKTGKPERITRTLPVHNFKSHILASIAENPVVIVVGDTGSGKTTQLTQFLLDAGYSGQGRMIACTQPRRLAAISIAERVADEMDELPVGGKVGYSVRFDDTSTDITEIKYMTDGILLRELISDPEASRYSAIMLDEAHERTVATDVLLALLKEASMRRPDMRIIVTSATLDAAKFSSYFGGAPIIKIPGRTYPVTIEYLEEPVLDYIEAALDTVSQIHTTKTDAADAGDVLVFLTGQAEIEEAALIIGKRYPKGDLYAVPVYAAIPSELQSLIFEPAPPGKRKVVLATNIAETSLTIDGIRYVVDPGFAKVQVYDSKQGMSVLKVQPISQAQANQRSGRAGRTAPGICYRLFTQKTFETEMSATTAPEIQRENLGNTVLLLKSMGIDDVMSFDFMDAPPKTALVESMKELYLLEAVNENAQITEIGRQMSRFPLDPPLAKIILVASTKGPRVLEDVLTIIAMLSGPPVFYRPAHPASKRSEADAAHRSLWDPSGDHITLLLIFKKWAQSGKSKKWCEKKFIQFKSLLKVDDALCQLRDIPNKGLGTISRQNKNFEKVPEATHRNTIIQTLCTGFFRNVAKLQAGGDYLILSGDLSVSIHPSSALFRKQVPYVMYSSLLLTSREYIHTVTQVQPEWLVETVPQVYRRETTEDSRKRQRSESIVPLHDRRAPGKNAWRISEQRTTLSSGRK